MLILRMAQSCRHYGTGCISCHTMPKVRLELMGTPSGVGFCRLFPCREECGQEGVCIGMPH
jgi:hypothetical protein